MKKSRKAVALLLAALTLSAMVMSGCGSKEKLKVGMEIGYPPFEYYDADGTTPIGVDVELANAIGEELNMEVELIDTAWDGIFAGLAKGDYDCIMSAVTITSERLLEFDFSQPYIQNYQCIVSLKDGAVKPASVDELAGLKVGYQEETTSDIYLTEYKEENNLDVETYEYAKVIQVFDELKLGRIDAIICDSTVAVSYTSGDSIYEITWMQESDPEEFGVCIQKGNSDLVNKVNTALDNLKKNGKLDEILDKYF